MSNSKLLKVMDYLINEQEDKARELLHQLFIEKARAIHEELMSEDDMEEETLRGDKGLGLGDEIEHHIDEVESEEHYGDGSEETMEDVDLDDAVSDLSDDLGDDDDEVDVADDEEHMDADAEEMDHDAEEMDSDEEEMDDDEEDMDADEEDMAHDEDSEEQRISDLEQEVEELKALYADIKGGNADHEEHAEEDDMEESWMDESDLEEEFSDLEESLELDTVALNAKKAAEVGSGKFARPEANTKSAVASNAPNMNGAKPVVTKGKVHSGYDREAAPASGDMKLGDNRDIKRTQVSKEGSTKALINKDRSEGFGAPNQKSPLGSGTTPKK